MLRFQCSIHICFKDIPGSIQSCFPNKSIQWYMGRLKKKECLVIWITKKLILNDNASWWQNIKSYCSSPWSFFVNKFCSSSCLLSRSSPVNVRQWQQRRQFSSVERRLIKLEERKVPHLWFRGMPLIACIISSVDPSFSRSNLHFYISICTTTSTWVVTISSRVDSKSSCATRYVAIETAFSSKVS